MPEHASQRAVLITGATGTLGSEITRLLAADGQYSIYANYSRDAERATRLQRTAACELACADVTDEAEVTALFRSLPPLFGVIHLAGIARDGVLAKQTRAQWDESLRVNCDSAFLVVRAALQKLENGGRLVLFSSRVAERGRAGQTAYSAAKAAQIALMKCAAHEGAARRVTVNVVCPGFVRSAMSRELSTSALEAARRESLFDEYGTSGATASLVAWLLGSEAAEVSGQIFHCDSRL